jgi:hypothetical protein
MREQCESHFECIFHISQLRHPKGVNDIDGTFNGVDKGLFEGLANFDSASDGSRD